MPMRPGMGWVDPRSRGGDTTYGAGDGTTTGRSPLTRGRLRHRLGLFLCRGSIPAHAGETVPALPHQEGVRVDPRSRGGDPTSRDGHTARAGRSPLTRGRHDPLAFIMASARSIPAHAGETSSAPAVVLTDRVDPRSRGGDSGVPDLVSRTRGRSPLTRGRLVVVRAVVTAVGSIPAHAGETRKFNPLC